MKTSTLVLLVVGVLLEAVALLTSYPDRFPIVLRVVSPEYQNAKKALALLDNMKPVTRESDGFAELERLFLAPLRKENPPEVFENVKLVRISRTKTIGSQAFTSHDMVCRIPLEFGKLFKSGVFRQSR